MDRLEFTDSELSDNGTSTTAIPKPSRTDKASYLDRFPTRMVTAALMAARRGGSMVRRQRGSRQLNRGFGQASTVYGDASAHPIVVNDG